jgi:HEPN domain-containing protein
MAEPEAVNIFIVAEQFRNAGKLATLIPVMASDIPALTGVSRMYLPTASMVSGALSLELYFKCLIRMRGKPYPRGHNLERLFHSIKPDDQVTIKRHFEEHSEQVQEYVERQYRDSGRPLPKPNLFECCLFVSKDAFALLRYSFERGMPPDTGWLGDAIVECARQTILDEHPDWEGKNQTSPLPETSFRSR